MVMYIMLLTDIYVVGVKNMRMLISAVILSCFVIPAMAAVSVPSVDYIRDVVNDVNLKLADTKAYVDDTVADVKENIANEIQGAKTYADNAVSVATENVNTLLQNEIQGAKTYADTLIELTKNASNLTSGTVAVERLPVGTVAATVASGADKRFDTLSLGQPADVSGDAQRVVIWVEQ